jgi:hypothetical protein
VLRLDSQSFLTNSTGSSQQLDRSAQAALATEFQPELRFSAGERFFPLRADMYAAAAHLCVAKMQGSRFLKLNQTCRSAKPSPTPVSVCRPKHKDAFMKGEPFPTLDSNRIDVRSHDPRDEQPYLLLEKRLRAQAQDRYTVYWHVAPAGLRHVMIEYWFFYSFDDSANRHEGDWEWIGVETQGRLALQTPQPIRVFYSQHEEGGWRDWGEMVNGRDRHGNSPIVYVASGSHANYFTPSKLPARPQIPAICTKVNRRKKANRRKICFVENDSLTRPIFILLPATAHPPMQNGSSMPAPYATYDLLPYPDETFSGAYGPGNYIPEGSWRAGSWLIGLGPFAPQCKREFDYPLSAFDKSNHEPWRETHRAR